MWVIPPVHDDTAGNLESVTSTPVSAGGIHPPVNRRSITLFPRSPRSGLSQNLAGNLKIQKVDRNSRLSGTLGPRALKPE